MLRNEVVTFKVFPNYLASTCFSILSSNGAYCRIFVLHKILSLLIFFHIGFAFAMKLSNTGCSWCSVPEYGALPSPPILEQNLSVIQTVRKEMCLMQLLCRDCGPDCVNQDLSALDSGFQDCHQSQKSYLQPKALSG